MTLTSSASFEDFSHKVSGGEFSCVRAEAAQHGCMKEINVEGEHIEVEEDWNCFQPEEIDQIRVLKELEIDSRLCSAITIAKTRDGRFFALWSERHPEMVPIEELHGCSPGWIFRQFIKLEKRMPSEHFAEEISRRDAYSIIAFLWLPKEFHPEAGV